MPLILDPWLENHRAVRTAAGWLFKELFHGELAGSRSYALRFLRRFREDLSEHFAWEERGPVAEVLRSGTPEHRQRAERIVREHDDFTARLEALIAGVDEAPPKRALPIYLETELERLLGDLRTHDELEDELWAEVRRSGGLPGSPGEPGPTTSHTEASV